MVNWIQQFSGTYRGATGRYIIAFFFLQFLPDLTPCLHHLRYAQVSRCVNGFYAKLLSSLTLFHIRLSDLYHDKLVGLVYR